MSHQNNISVPPPPPMKPTPKYVGEISDKSAAEAKKCLGPMGAWVWLNGLSGQKNMFAFYSYLGGLRSKEILAKERSFLTRSWAWQQFHIDIKLLYRGQLRDEQGRLII